MKHYVNIYSWNSQEAHFLYSGGVFDTKETARLCGEKSGNLVKVIEFEVAPLEKEVEK